MAFPIARGEAANKINELDCAHYIEKLNFTEARFVLVVMVVAATRPVAGSLLRTSSRSSAETLDATSSAAWRTVAVDKV